MPHMTMVVSASGWCMLRVGQNRKPIYMPHMTMVVSAGGWCTFRVGQIRIPIYMPYMTVHLMKSLQKMPYVLCSPCVYMVLAKPVYASSMP